MDPTPKQLAWEEEMGEERIPEDTKLEINNMLWRVLPGEISLSRAESIACRIFDMIRDEYEQEDRKPKEK